MAIGLMMLGTNGGGKKLEGEKHADIFAQPLHRSITVAQLPDLLLREAMDLMASIWGDSDDAMHKLRSELILKHSLKAHELRLRAGATMAREVLEVPNWSHRIDTPNIPKKMGERK